MKFSLNCWVPFQGAQHNFFRAATFKKDIDYQKLV